MTVAKDRMISQLRQSQRRDHTLISQQRKALEEIHRLLQHGKYREARHAMQQAIARFTPA